MINQAATSYQKALFHLTLGIDALEGVSQATPDLIEQEQLTPEQLACVLRCIHYSLLQTQQTLIAHLAD